MAREAEEREAQAARLHQLKAQTRGITFKKIGEAVGVTERQVQRWFTGESDIGPDKYKPLARYMGTTADYIQHGVMARRRNPTPDLSETSQLDQIQLQLERIETNQQTLLANQQTVMEAVTIANLAEALTHAIRDDAQARTEPDATTAKQDRPPAAGAGAG